MVFCAACDVDDLGAGPERACGLAALAAALIDAWCHRTSLRLLRAADAQSPCLATQFVRGGIPMPVGNLLESLSQSILVGILLVANISK